MTYEFYRHKKKKKDTVSQMVECEFTRGDPKTKI